MKKPWISLGSMLLSAALLAGCSLSGPGASEREAPPVAESPSPPSSPTPSPQERPSPESTRFSFKDVKPGDQLGPWTVVSIEPMMVGTEWDENNVTMSFKGEATLEGFYWYDPDSEFLGDLVLVTPAREDLAFLPRPNDNVGRASFVIKPSEAFPPYTGGWARVHIQDYVLTIYPSEVWNEAALLDGEVMGHLPLKKDITFSLEGMPESQMFLMEPMPGEPLVTYRPFDWSPAETHYEKGGALRLAPIVGDAYGWVQFFWADPGVTLEEARGLMEEELQGYAWEKAPLPPEMPWVKEHFIGKKGPLGQQKIAHHYLGMVENRTFSLLTVLENPEAGDGFGPRADVIIKEARFLKTGEGLVRP
ncbi:MAG: hypothetical protein KM310_03935 [Clostridiales bacterium]|nr:hypothetical protein [Clostridiales bacterium]